METVYFLQGTSDREVVKIGRSINVPDRIKKAGTFRTDDYDVLLTISGKKGLEAELHNRFAKYRIFENKEWFHMSAEIKKYIEVNKPRDLQINKGEIQQTIEGSTLHFTRDYSKFFIGENRRVDEKRVVKFMKDMSSRNLLHVSPLIMNQNGFIVDGQHRYEAARRLGVAFYYIIGNVTPEDIASMNKNTVKWSTEDFLGYYVVLGKEHYIRLHQLCEKYPEIPLRTLIEYSQYTRWDRSTGTERFKSGQYEYVAEDHVEKLAKMLQDFIPILGKNGAVTGTVIHLYRNKSYRHHHMMDQLVLYPYMVHKCGNSAQYLEMLQDIYNYKQRQDKKVYLTKL